MNTPDTSYELFWGYCVVWGLFLAYFLFLGRKVRTLEKKHRGCSE